MAWSEDHNRYLNITWDELPSISPIPLSAVAMLEYRDEYSPLHVLLKKLFLPCTRNEAPVCDVLPKLYPRSSILSLRADPFAEMRLWFDSRVYRYALRVECLWRWPYPRDTDASQSFVTESTLDAYSNSDEDAPSKCASAKKFPPHCVKPMLAYVGRDWLRGFRMRHMRVPLGPGHVPNDPVARLCALQKRQLSPEDPERDPRFAAILIAMAQEHVYPAYPTPPRFAETVPPRVAAAPDFRDVTVRLLTHSFDGDFMVYKVTVTADYLRQFHHPLKAFQQESSGGGPPGLEIEMTRVPESPMAGLGERLGAAVGEDIAGSFPGNPTWKFEAGDDDEERRTPDMERWNPLPKEVVGLAEDGMESEETAKISENPDEGMLGPEWESEGDEGVAEETRGVADVPVFGKRRREAEISSLDGVGKKGRLSENQGSTMVTIST